MPSYTSIFEGEWSDEEVEGSEWMRSWTAAVSRGLRGLREAGLEVEVDNSVALFARNKGEMRRWEGNMRVVGRVFGRVVVTEGRPPTVVDDDGERGDGDDAVVRLRGEGGGGGGFCRLRVPKRRG